MPARKKVVTNKRRKNNQHQGRTRLVTYKRYQSPIPSAVNRINIINVVPEQLGQHPYHNARNNNFISSTPVAGLFPTPPSRPSGGRKVSPRTTINPNITPVKPELD